MSARRHTSASHPQVTVVCVILMAFHAIEYCGVTDERCWQSVLQQPQYNRGGPGEGLVFRQSLDSGPGDWAQLSPCYQSPRVSGATPESGRPCSSQ